MFNKFLLILFGIGFITNSALANEIPTLGSITAQRGVLEDLNLQVQIQEQSQKLNQLLTPVIQTPSELSAKQLIEKLEVPGQSSDEKDTASSTDSGSDNRSSKVIAIYSNNNTLKAKIKYKGKVDTVTNGQEWNGLKVQIFRDRVLLGNKILEL